MHKNRGIVYIVRFNEKGEIMLPVREKRNTLSGVSDSTHLINYSTKIYPHKEKESNIIPTNDLPNTNVEREYVCVLDSPLQYIKNIFALIGDIFRYVKLFIVKVWSCDF